MKFATKEEKIEFKQNQKNLRREKLKTRITEIDLIRGICILIMIFDHAMYDFLGFLPSIFSDFPFKTQFTTDLYKFARWWWYWPVRVNVRYFVLFCFFALTGISCSFSRSNLKRGFQLLIFSLCITLVTFIFGKITGDTNMTIVFGVLQCIAVSIILSALVEKITKNKWVFLAIGLVMVVVGFILEFVTPGKTSARYGDEPFILLLLKAMVGLVHIGNDCFQLLFYGGQVFIGVFLGKWLYSTRKSLIFKGDYRNNFITLAGRHSLLIYLAHQVILPLFFGIILLIAGFQLRF